METFGDGSRAAVAGTAAASEGGEQADRGGCLQNAVLICVSLFFYAYGEPVFVFVMIGSVLVNYLLALVIAKSAEPAVRKAVLAVAAVCNIALLVVFKYLGFFAQIVGNVFHISLSVPELALPIGISFFTFQILSYVIDVYRKPELVQRNFFYVLLYISFFPQLIAGPIVKYHDIYPYLKKRKLDISEMAAGLNRFILGLFKKLYFANSCGMIADQLFARTSEGLSAKAAWLAAVSYALQIYFDFSGYSDMAIGIGHMFGFTFLENFQHPYSSCSMKEFWQKWHMSLSLWFREYVYIPLGGNRRGLARAEGNRLAVFFLTGLWHGASVNFVLWGMIHGVSVVLEDLVRQRHRRTGAKDKPGHLEQTGSGKEHAAGIKETFSRILGWCYTMLIVIIAFVFFRAETISQGLAVISGMFSMSPGTVEEHNLLVTLMSPYYVCMLCAAAVTAFPVRSWLQRRLGAALRARGADQPERVHSSQKKGRVFCWFVCGMKYLFLLTMLAASCANVAGASFNPFIYFRF